MADDGVTVLPDGSAFAVAEFPLPKDHWIYGDRAMERKVDYGDGTHGWHEPPPMPMRMGTDNSQREAMADMVRQAARYALRASTMKGQEDFDPDAVVQNMVVGFLGYFTPDGYTDDEWANPVDKDNG